MKKTLLSTMLLASVAVAPVALAQGAIESLPSFIGKASASGAITSVLSVTENGSYDIQVAGENGTSGTLQNLNISGTVFEPTSKISTKGNSTTITYSANKTAVKNSLFITAALGNATIKGYKLGAFTWTDGDDEGDVRVVAYKNPTKSAPGEIVEVEALTLTTYDLLWSITSGRTIDKPDSGSASLRLNGYSPVSWSFEGFGGTSIANVSYVTQETPKSYKESGAWSVELRSLLAL